MLDDLPGTFRSLRGALRLAYRAEPRLLLLTFGLIVGQWVPESLGALWLKLLADGVTEQRTAPVVVATVGLASSVAGRWVLRELGERLHLTFRERANVAVEAHVAMLQASLVSVAHQERPDYLDRLQVVRESAGLLNHLYQSIMQTVGDILRLCITLALLVSVHPALVLLAPFALPAATLASWRAGAQRRAQEAAAPHNRLQRHLFDLGTRAESGKELRVTRMEDEILRRHRESWSAAYVGLSAERWRTTIWQAAVWTLFAAGYAGALAIVAVGMRASPGSVLLVLAAGGNLSRDLGAALGMGSWMRWTIDFARRLAWLEDYGREQRSHGDQPVPDRITSGIGFEDVTFRYPGTERAALTAVDLHLPAGKVVALVGENGAGKTTLVKLLCRLYEPSSGRITVDGADLARMPPDAWRSRVAGAMQDFVRYEFRAMRSVGLGDLPREHERPAVHAAVVRGGATDVVDRLPQGLDTQLGPTWAGGVELSIGQWQKLALARGLMREDPLLLVLDEPTASLDAQTEHALFERFASESRSRAGNGRVTVLVSHRFSTVRMADLILVVDAGRVVDIGTHDELMARGGLYAELYAIQARGYA